MGEPIHIVDLRRFTSRQLEPLFAEEQRHWLDELHWDYRPSIQLITKFVDSRSLAGFAALVNGQAAGYGFYVLEESKGLIGGLYVTPRLGQPGTAERLLSQLLTALRSAHGLGRIEAQLMPFGAPLDRAFAAASFRLFTRQFMVLPLGEARTEPQPIGAGLRLEPWDDRQFEPCARLIREAYASHVDSDINDQYRTEAGAMRFLKNIIVLPGCGQFLPEASFVVRADDGPTGALVAVALTSRVSHGVGHTTQLCVAPQHHHRGLGMRLMAAAIQALRSARFHALSLTVTAANAPAVGLYERLGFRTVKSFSAAVWQE